MPSKLRFPWRRFWCAPDALLSLEPDGFLTDCDDRYAKLFAPETKGFEEIKKAHCLILLGEPGIGKSTAVHDEILRTEETKGPGEFVLVVDLKEYGSEEFLWKALFENEVWGDYRKGSYKLHLFLDSLDEVRIRIANIQKLLMRGFRDCPLDGLFLRIACRTAEWPSSFYDQLCGLWSTEEVKLFELAPLTRKNVMQAAEIVGIDVANFMRAIHEKRLGALASKPVTLNFLMNLYLTHGDLPTGQVELYRQGCLYLCEEPDKERREKGDISKLYCGVLSARERLAIASRIAAVLTFSNSYAVSRNGLSETPEGCVPVAQLEGGKETTDRGTIDANDNAIQDTLKTGLFTSRGPELFGYAHQTYQEHLAAGYLRQADMRQIKELLTHPHDVDVIVPQLQETAAWVASERPDVMLWIMSIRPQNLLRSDLCMVDSTVKEELTEVLLRRIARDELFDDLSLRENYHKLVYPGIADKLRPIIENRALSFVARRAAIDIAEACNLMELQTVLANIALDTSEADGLRSQAAQAVCEIADYDTRQRLEPRGEGKLGDDPDDELSGCGLRCVWPGHWSLSKLVENLTPAKNKSLVGGYSYFLDYEVPDQLKKGATTDQTAKALAIANGWIGTDSKYDSHNFGRIYDELLRLSFKGIPDPVIMAELSDALLRSAMHGSLSDGNDENSNPWKQMESEVKKRHHLVKYMIRTGRLGERDATLLLIHETPLVLNSDFAWMLTEIEQAESPEQTVWARLILGILNPDLPVQCVSDFLEVRLRVPALERGYMVYWELDSDLSKKFKDGYAQRLRREQRAKRQGRVSPVAERIEPLLKRIELGDVEQWFALTHNLSIDQDTGQSKHWDGIELSETPGWKALDKVVRDRVEQAGVRFILNYSPPSDEWFGKGSWHQDILSVCMALLIVSKHGDFLDQIESTTFNKWIPYMVDNPVFFNDATAHCQLFSLAYRKAPETTKKYLIRLMKSEDGRGQGIHCIEYLKGCWHPDLTGLLLRILTNCELQANSFKSVARRLIEIGSEEIETIIIERFRLHVCESKGSGGIVVELALLLLKHWAEKYWNDLWEFLEKDKDLCSKVLGCVEPGYGHGASFAEELSDAHLGDLYSLMCKLWPPEEDPALGGGALTERHRLADIRSSIFMLLVNRGTREACAAIESLIEKFPDQRLWMKWRLREAQANYYRKTWGPPSAAQIIELLSNSTRRYVENEEELIEVVLESLTRFQRQCKNRTLPSAGNFWNYQGSGNDRKNFRPKDEEDLSDGIASWLRDDLGPSKGVVINREVQPRRGQETDIYINAVTRIPSGENAILTVVVEVKGCWHKELDKAMETQLVNRYMKENGLACGLYIVGWYVCDKWDDGDYRKKAAMQRSVQNLHKQLLAQAKDITARSDTVSKIEPFILDLTL